MPSKSPQKRLFIERLNQACNTAGIKPLHSGRQVSLADQMGVSQESVRKWLSGESYPSIERLAELSSVLGTSIAFLLGEGSLDQFKANIDRLASKAFDVLVESFPEKDHDELLKVSSRLALQMRKPS